MAERAADVTDKAEMPDKHEQTCPSANGEMNSNQSPSSALPVAATSGNAHSASAHSNTRGDGRKMPNSQNHGRYRKNLSPRFQAGNIQMTNSQLSYSQLNGEGKNDPTKSSQLNAQTNTSINSPKNDPLLLGNYRANAQYNAHVLSQKRGNFHIYTHKSGMKMPGNQMQRTYVQGARDQNSQMGNVQNIQMPDARMPNPQMGNAGLPGQTQPTHMMNAQSSYCQQWRPLPHWPGGPEQVPMQQYPQPHPHLSMQHLHTTRNMHNAEQTCPSANGEMNSNQSPSSAFPVAAEFGNAHSASAHPNTQGAFPKSPNSQNRGRYRDDLSHRFQAGNTQTTNSQLSYSQFNAEDSNNLTKNAQTNTPMSAQIAVQGNYQGNTQIAVQGNYQGNTQESIPQYNDAQAGFNMSGHAHMSGMRMPSPKMQGAYAQVAYDPNNQMTDAGMPNQQMGYDELSQQLQNTHLNTSQTVYFQPWTPPAGWSCVQVPVQVPLLSPVNASQGPQQPVSSTPNPHNVEDNLWMGQQTSQVALIPAQEDFSIVNQVPLEESSVQYSDGTLQSMSTVNQSNMQYLNILIFVTAWVPVEDEENDNNDNNEPDAANNSTIPDQ